MAETDGPRIASAHRQKASRQSLGSPLAAKCPQAAAMWRPDTLAVTARV